jgi:hypothetical protein
LIDTPVQQLDGSLDDFLLKQISVAGDDYATGTDPTHGTAMAEAILRAIAQASGGSTSAQILPVNVYSSGESTTSWDVALGIQAAVDNGANVLNLSLGGAGDSSVLDSVIQQAIAAGIPIFAAAGNQPVGTPTYPAADSGVMAVTATQGGQIAPYANYGSFVSGQPWAEGRNPLGIEPPGHCSKLRCASTSTVDSQRSSRRESALNFVGVMVTRLILKKSETPYIVSYSIDENEDGSVLCRLTQYFFGFICW